MTVRVKICGIQSHEEAEAAVKAGADALGFVFAKGAHYINPETAHIICEKIPPFISKVGVFVNSPKYEIMEIATLCHLDVLQFHGNETPGFCHGYSQQLIKAFKVKDTSVLDDLSRYPVDGHLLDTFLPGKEGGTGKTFDWDLAVKAKRLVNNLILAGGLKPDNITEALQQVTPYAVDVSTGVEKNGVKDYHLMQKFIQEVRKAERI